MFEVENKVVIITGGSGGLGSAMCKGFDEQGAIVYSVDIKQPEEKYIRFVKTDLTDENQLRTLVDRIIKEQGHIDVLVNCAAVTGKPWDEVIAVNLTAPYKLTTLVTEHMKKKEIKGSIINIGSLNAIVALPNNPMYIASKGGIAAMTRSFATDLGKYGIRVNCIHPGYFKTPLNAGSLADPILYEKRSERTMLGRWGEPEEIVGACIFLASDAASYITGAGLRVDGGWTNKGLSQ